MVTDRGRDRTSLLPALLGFLAILLADFALAQSQEKGDASLRVEYQYIRNGTFNGSGYEAGWWTSDTHVTLLSGDYALSDRWTIYGALPYVQKRFNATQELPGFAAGDPHNPNDDFWVDFVPPDKRFIDDGSYHGGIQDLSIGVSYLALDGPLTVSPYIGFGYPADNYPFYAKAAIGANLWNIPVGVSLSYVPYFSDWFFRGNLAYVFSEQPLGQNVDYWLGFLSAGYFFKPQFALNIFGSVKYLRDGLVLPWDFTDDPTFGNYPEEFDTEEWYHHDRLLKHRFAYAGIAFDYFPNEKYKLTGSYYQGFWADQTQEIDRAYTFALTRYYGGE